ncbi:MAG: phosphatase PAP2 family protein [Anaerolineae bacterium]|nr:phosphatase PAP2 family protein [Anaerolineae bacterium]
MYPILRTFAVIKKNDEAIARWISHLISPHIVGVALTAFLAVKYSDESLAEVLTWLALLIPLLVIPPLIYLLWLVNKGQIEDIYMPKRETRLRPLLVMLVWLSACLWLIDYWAAPPVVGAFVLATIILVTILSVVTLFWKISFHGATISAAAATAFMIIGSSALPIMLLVPLVGWSRIRLARHTPRQVLYGSLVGILFALIMVQGILQGLL